VLAQTFQGVANEWLELQKKSLAPETIWSCPDSVDRLSS
jgi:hypothetical protein